MKRIVFLFFSGLLLLPSCSFHRGDRQGGSPCDSIPAMGFWREDYSVDSITVRSGETFGGLLSRLGLSPESAYTLTRLCDTVFDVRKFRAGSLVEAYYDSDSLARTLEYLVYNNDRVNSTVFKCSDSLAVWRYSKPVTTLRRKLDLTIHSSLLADIAECGASPLLAYELEDIYAWTVNFFALQDGDRFRAIYEEKSCEGEVIGIDKVDFCIYSSGGFEAPAIRFDQHDGGNRYWNEKGESMRKAFLKAPLKFTRISSRFTYHRKHPVTGKVRAHTAVDYAAPSGTPVHSIGDGTVIQCGWDSHGGGNRIRIRHMNGYETSYMHLRGFAKGIRSGVRVSQGQLIGYVGSTGMSTGPHLDFRVWKNGTPVDPLKMISPPAQPLKQENLDSLGKLYSAFLDEISDKQ